MPLIQLGIGVLFVIIVGFLGVQNSNLKEENSLLHEDLVKTEEESASTTASLSKVIDELEDNLQSTLGENAEKDREIKETISVLQGVRGDLEVTEGERDQLEVDLKNEEAKIGILSEQVSSITNVVNQIDKLSKTDDELLKKYSKVYFLNEHYIPIDMVLIEDEYVYNSENRYWFHRDAYNHLKQMMNAAFSDGIDITIISSYRSFYKQAALKETYSVTYGEGANTFAADQGYSEHQLGTTIDFTNSEIGLKSEGFEGTPTYFWLLSNAYKYGFVQSYPQNNEFYIFEPWHWRFVGAALTEKLHSEGKYFYDEEQRVLSSYLISIFDPLIEDVDE